MLGVSSVDRSLPNEDIADLEDWLYVRLILHVGAKGVGMRSDCGQEVVERVEEEMTDGYVRRLGCRAGADSALDRDSLKPGMRV